jgi:hypothetical protein
VSDRATPASASRAFRLLFLLLFAVLGGCERVVPGAYSSDIDELLASGERYARALSSANTAELPDAEVIALGYLERTRLGLSSPFRLIAFAREDERLEPATRERLAYAILNLTLQGRGYQLDPSVLDVIQFIGVQRAGSAGEQHLRLIERSIAEAPSALSGERAVRLGYMLASTERTLEGSPDPVVAYVAAMVADRRRAREDAADLLRTASQLRMDPLELAELWRKHLRLRVERPALAVVSSRDEVNESRRGEQLAVTLRVLAQRLSAPTSRLAHTPPHDFWGDSWLDAQAAARLSELAAAHDYPAQAPIAVAVMINRPALLARPGLSVEHRGRRRQFADVAINEEKLVGGAAELRAVRADRGPRLSLILLQSSVFLRGWNQEEPWFPGDAAPTSRDLENRFGLASISFDADVPEAWRPYYRRMLGRSLGELHRVLPASTVRGLNVRIGATPSSTPALALHEPRTRTLTLPPHTGAGTIAHEIAHDLDWQLARKRYGRRGSYATDLAVGRQKGDRLAASLTGLSAAFARDADDGVPTAHDHRPAEVFARGMDWLVAAYLAHDGRAGGYLTSFQDAALPGYGTARGPQLDGQAVPSLLSILDQIAPVPLETRLWALDAYGPSRSLTAKELVRVITAASRDGVAFDRFQALESARDKALDGLSAVSCRMTPSEEARQVVAARQRVIRTAAASAARGIVIDGLREVSRSLEDPVPHASVDDFLIWRLDGGPEPADSSVHVLQPVADELILRAERVTTEAVVANGGFELNPERALCGGNPFASELVERRGVLLNFPRRPHREM